MSSVTQSDNLILNNSLNQEVKNFWQNQRLDFSVTESTNILSFACQIPRVDPLACLRKFSDSSTLSFYWENCSKQEAVAAWGVARSSYINSNSRFKLAQKFVQSCFRQITRAGETNLALSKPVIFCAFTFFSEVLKTEPFPPATLFLPRWQIVKQGKNCCLIINYPLNQGQNSSSLISQLSQQVNSIDWSALGQVYPSPNSSLASMNREQSEDPEHFKSVVKSALNSIAEGKLNKIVLAHTAEISLTKAFNLEQSLANMRSLHPDCYIFATSNGKGQNFVGASPERLLSVQNKQIVTDALAGSAPRGANNSEDLRLANLLLKNRKEKREHESVRDFIMASLQSIGLKPQQLPMQLLKLSNIQHLWTPIYADLPGDIQPLEVVELLHPTPAVAGVPSEVACEQILAYEKFERSLYAAPLGWVDEDGNCEFIVGIRSALIDGDRATLYAGSGIVSGSNPDKEFAEIQLKLQSVLKALV
ncbi:MAG: isochorismate synthase [Cyanobacteria bacterium J06621_8]